MLPAGPPIISSHNDWFVEEPERELEALSINQYHVRILNIPPSFAKLMSS